MSSLDKEIASDLPSLWWRGTEPFGSSKVINYMMGDSTLYPYPNAGNGKTGWAYGVTFGVPGPTHVKCDTAMSFTGFSGSYVNTYWTLIGGLSTIAVECWFQRGAASLTGNGRLMNVDQTDTTNNGFELYLQGGTTPRFVIGSGTAITDIQSSVAITDQNWHHVMCVLNGGATTLTMWLDGVQVAQSTSAIGTMAQGSTSLTCGVGTYGGDPFQGNLSNVAVYSHLLTQDRAVARVNAAATLNPPQRPYLQYLVAWASEVDDDPTLFTIGSGGVADYLTENVWTDITPFVTGHSIDSRGRQYELDEFQAGNLTVTLTNYDNRFSPWNASSPYGGPGYIRPKRWIAVLANGIFRFMGKITEIDPQWPDPKSSTAQILASETMRDLQSATMGIGLFSLSAQRYQQEGGAYMPPGGILGWFPLSDNGGSIAADSSGNNMAANYFGAVTYNVADGPVADLQTSVTVNTGGLQIPNGWTAATTGSMAVTAYIKTTSSTPAPGTPLITLSNDWGMYEINGDIAMVTPSGTFAPAATQINDGNWWQICLYYDTAGGSHGTFFGSAEPAIVAIAANAVTEAGSIVSNGSNYTTGPSTLLTIGGGSFTGSICNVMINSGTNQYFDVPYQLLLAFWGFTSAYYAGDAIDDWSSYLLPLTMTNISSGNTQIAQQIGQNEVSNSMLSYLQQMETTDGGVLFNQANGCLRFMSKLEYLTLQNSTPFLTIGDTPSSGQIPFQASPTLVIDDQRIFNDAEAENSYTGNSARTINQASLTKYGYNKWSANSSFMSATDAIMISRLQYIVARYSDPQQRLDSIQIMLEDLTNDSAQINNLKNLLQLDVMSAVNIVRSEVGFSQRQIIEQVAETVDVDSWQITFGVSSPDPWHYWVWNTSSWDNGDVWSY